MEYYEVILKQLECVMRGKRIDESTFLKQTEDFLNWSFSEYERIELSKSHLDHETQQKFTDLAVKLHNKSKQVHFNSKVFSECITNLKAAAAWILTTYGSTSTKYVIMFIRLHCRAASEMLLIEKLNYAESSLKKVFECWKMLNSQALERILPPVDLEGLRFQVFNAFLDYSKLLRTSSGREDEIRNCIGCALELLDYLPNLRLAFCRHALDIGQELAIQKSAYHEAIHYLRIALSSLHILQSTKESENEEAQILLMKTYLSMAFVFQEMNEIEKGLGAVSEAESLGMNITPPETILFAKFSLLCRACDEIVASRTLELLFEATSSFDMAVNSLILFLKFVGHGNLESYRKYLDYFNILGKKFNTDIDFSSLRILHLQYTFMALGDANEDQSDEYFLRAKEICSAIIRDHQQRIRPLPADLYKKFVHLLRERVNLHRSQGRWLDAIYWCDLMLSFVETTDQTNWTAIMMWKSDSCLQLDDRREEALTLALACVKMIKSTNTILLALNTALHMCPPEQVTEIFFSLLKDCPSGLQSPFEEGNLYPESVDYLSRLMLGCQVLAECTASNLDSCCLEKCDGKFRDMIKSSFLIHWMQNYLQYRTSARIDLEDSGSMDLSADQADGGKSITIAFCDVLLELFSGFLKINLVVRDSSKNDTFAQASNAFDLDMSRYDIACSARHIRNCLFVHLKHLLIVLEESKDNLSYNPPVYHKLESIVSVAELSWNLGVLLSGKTVVESQHDYLQLAIDLLELSERLFYYLSTKDSADQHEVFRFKCLLSSTSLRLDLSSSLSKLIQSNTTVEEGKFQEKSCIESEETQNISQLSANIEIMSQMCDFIQQTDLLKLHMILTLAVYCRTNNSKLEAYVDMNQNQFLTFTPQELEKCADIAQNERYGNLAVCRKMLQLGIQVLARDAIQDFPLLGSLYKRLIQISPNRLQALERIEDFEQIIRANSIESSSELPFSISDIDSICIMCYNWGVTLAELSQYDLAEKFACKALGFSKYVSSNVSKLKETIQDAYLYILKTKVEQKGEALTSNIAHFGLTSSSHLSTQVAPTTNQQSLPEDVDMMLVGDEKEASSISE